MSADLVAVDVGGTNSRFALAFIAGDGSIALQEPVTLATSDYASLQTAWEAFERRCGCTLPRSAAVAIAGPVTGKVVRMTNNSWVLDTGAMDEQLGLDRMRAAARDLQPRDAWDRLAVQRVADDLPRQQSELAIAAIRHAERAKASPARIDRAAAQALVEAWIAPRKTLADRLIQPMSTFDRHGDWSLAKLVLLGDAVREFVYASRAEADR